MDAVLAERCEVELAGLPVVLDARVAAGDCAADAEVDVDVLGACDTPAEGDAQGLQVVHKVLALQLCVCLHRRSPVRTRGVHAHDRKERDPVLRVGGEGVSS